MNGFAIVMILIGIFILINTLNGNLPKLIDWPGIHTSSIEFNTAPVAPSLPDVQAQQLQQAIQTHG